MAKFFIANCSQQRQIISYRLDYEPNGLPNELRRFVKASETPPIPPGGQIALHGGRELDIVTQIPHLITQLERIGLTAEKDIGRIEIVTVYVYNIDQPVKETSIREVMEFNAGVRAREGANRRRAAAIAANNVLETNAAQAILPQPETFETSVEQIDLVTDESRLEEGYRLGNPTGAPPSAPRTGRHRKAA